MTSKVMPGAPGRKRSRRRLNKWHHARHATELCRSAGRGRASARDSLQFERASGLERTESLLSAKAKQALAVLAAWNLKQ